MKCPTCVNEGTKSTLSVGMSITTSMYFSPFYDEDGKYHHHDGNTTTTSYRCSNGHEFSDSRTGSCWCGWGVRPEDPQKN